ncbi:hypothetical protein ABIE40_000830 [Rhizobium sp. OAE497]
MKARSNPSMRKRPPALYNGAALNAALWIAAEKDSAEVFAKAVEAFKQLASGLLKTPA